MDVRLSTLPNGAPLPRRDYDRRNDLAGIQRDIGGKPWGVRTTSITSIHPSLSGGNQRATSPSPARYYERSPCLFAASAGGRSVTDGPVRAMTPMPETQEEQ
jgi:hypothetical protein